MWTDRRQMTKQIVAFRNFAKALKNQKIHKHNKKLIKYPLQLLRATLVLRPSCVLEQVVVNEKGVNHKNILPSGRRV